MQTNEMVVSNPKPVFYIRGLFKMTVTVLTFDDSVTYGASHSGL